MANNNNVIELTTPSGWSVTFVLIDSRNVHFDVNGEVIINKVGYKVYGDIRYGKLLAWIKRTKLQNRDATPSARKKAHAEISALMPAISKVINAGTVTRDGMTFEIQETINRIEANMQELMTARAALMGLAEEINEMSDSELRYAAESRERAQIASYYERQRAMHIPHYVEQMRKMLLIKKTG